jgi:xanthine dehydrogenase accessory factor
MTPLQLIHAWQEQRRSCDHWCVASLVETQGSVPRNAGAWMMIGVNRQSSVQAIGSIGGGAAEAHVINQAVTQLASKSTESLAFPISLRAGVSAQTSLDEQQFGVCGGHMSVVLQVFDTELLGQRLEGVAKLLRQVPDVYVCAFSLLPTDSQNRPRLRLYTKAHCWIGGAGHCGAALARILLNLGYPLTVVDARTDIMAPALDSRAARLFDWRQTLLQSYGSQQIVLLLSRNMEEDLLALDALHDRYEPNEGRLAWIGMMGSKRRAHLVLRARKWQKGFDQKIITPIGLDIGAQTPDEIAIAIAAQVIQLSQSD